MRVLVTGGGGFIGSNLTDRLLAEGHEVRILDSFATGQRENLAHVPDAEVVEGDIQSYERAHHATRGCEVVFHQAALPSVPRSVQDPLTSHAVNATGTLNVLLAARDNGARRVVYASSSSVYGANPDLPKREDMPVAPISPYAVGKHTGEAYCRAFSHVYGLECVSLRYFNVFGPRQNSQSQYAAVIPKFIEALLAGRQPTIFGDGGQSRDFTYVENVVEANLHAMVAERAVGGVFNIACGERISLNQLVSRLRELLDVETTSIHRDPRPGDVRHSQADISLARDVLGYNPLVSFDEGLHSAIGHLAGECRPQRASAS